MNLYNTLIRRKECFVPPGKPVRMYVCGVTPYDTTHLGHARTYVFFDVLRRYLRQLGHDVRYIQNVTDVDTPLFERARALAMPYDELAAQNLASYFADMAALHVQAPTGYPHASEEIAGMIEMVGGLLDRGHAYRRGATVFFRVASARSYGELSRLSRAEMIARGAEQGNDPADRRKEDALDFVLWQPSAGGEPSWPSPWGAGRPGWHIECSTMATRYLGQSIDLHGGGDDLVFPHHESEIAQSEAYTGVRPFARYWVHTGMVRLDGVKMSKSLGNLVMVRDLLGEFSPDAIRLYLLGHPYRAAFDYDRASLAAAEAATARLRAALARPGARNDGLDARPFRARFLAALDDDLDTPAAIRALDDLAGAVSGAGAGADVYAAQATLRDAAPILGLEGILIESGSAAPHQGDS